MTHQIKMIGIDLDGTLLTTEKKLLPFTRQVLSEAIEKGILVVMATGRPCSGITEEPPYISRNPLCPDVQRSEDCGYVYPKGAGGTPASPQKCEKGIGNLTEI